MSKTNTPKSGVQKDAVTGQNIQPTCMHEDRKEDKCATGSSVARTSRSP